MTADGDSKADVVIQVWDVNNVFMDSDTPNDVKVDIRHISARLLTDGCHSSVSTGEFVVGTLDRDFFVTVPDSGIGAVATIKARAGGYFGFNGSHQIVIKTGRAYSKTSSVDVALSVVYGTAVPIEVPILDCWGNPLGVP